MKGFFLVSFLLTSTAFGHSESHFLKAIGVHKNPVIKESKIVFQLDGEEVTAHRTGATPEGMIYLYYTMNENGRPTPGDKSPDAREKLELIDNLEFPSLKAMRKYVREHFCDYRFSGFIYGHMSRSDDHPVLVQQRDDISSDVLTMWSGKTKGVDGNRKEFVSCK